MSTATLENDPRKTQPRHARPVPRLFPDELRTQPQPSVHEAEPAWSRSVPANPERALAEIAEKVFTAKDKTEIQRLENELAKVDADRKNHCDSSKMDQALWDLSQDLTLSPEEYAEGARKIENERLAIPQWTVALDRKDADLKEKLRPFALKLSVELPGLIAKEINKQENEAGPDGIMAFWGIAQNFDPAITVNPLRRLHDLAVSWLASLQSNDADAKESRIRAILADSGVLKPTVFVFRSQF
jgi:hypothetical protein